MPILVPYYIPHIISFFSSPMFQNFNFSRNSLLRSVKGWSPYPERSTLFPTLVWLLLTTHTQYTPASSSTSILQSASYGNNRQHSFLAIFCKSYLWMLILIIDQQLWRNDPFWINHRRIVVNYYENFRFLVAENIKHVKTSDLITAPFST